jgi:hypothetical protein
MMRPNPPGPIDKPFVLLRGIARSSVAVPERPDVWGYVLSVIRPEGRSSTGARRMTLEADGRIVERSWLSAAAGQERTARL